MSDITNNAAWWTVEWSESFDARGNSIGCDWGGSLAFAEKPSDSIWEAESINAKHENGLTFCGNIIVTGINGGGNGQFIVGFKGNGRLEIDGEFMR